MAKKSKTEATPAPVVSTETETPVVAEPAVAEKTKVKKTKAKKVVVATTEEVVVEPTPVVVAEPEPEVVAEPTPVVVESAPAVVEDVSAETEEKPAEKKKRRLVTKDNLLKSIDEFQKELLPILEAGNHKKVIKAYKTIIADTYRLLRIKTASRKNKDATNSGFMRPVKASAELEKFLVNMGEKLDTPLTRAHLTTLICKYIKDKNLQNPEDRRIIFPDDALCELFSMDKDDKSLTYYNIQKKMQPHLSRIEDVLA